jgi:hypothetical protein
MTLAHWFDAGVIAVLAFAAIAMIVPVVFIAMCLIISGAATDPRWDDA